ncbi:AbrB/MazE/SpoVT family DNA-binding domain-containing protein [Paenibacillus sp. GCM10023248]|uniref:AbrB/MazE/SpoVT family DNA-binding domain-containing protein n=1 Tax=Bacillales TaxID=1385 RepID=UPI0023798228|nr:MULTISPECIES: AbrB/MazE/SpoVT family DNA-binding domain-containing protein [Bacillales]MDD9268111.1 AbrB/MazE/SpoVT family DNA-binding domain-containing protein [Paenibacillus sp. MAHUQ-63]MDR6879789.1 transcriptional pleiotropic regulator of transition state genes [Bacillus sp. 3255]
MKATGIVRKVDQLGRIVLPIEMRRLLNIGTDDEVKIYCDEERVIVTKCVLNCIFCGSEREPYYFKRKLICKVCLDEIAPVEAGQARSGEDAVHGG